MRYWSALFLILVLPVGSCEQIVDPAPFLAFHYTSYDSTGIKVAQGWFTMDISDPDSVTGEWHFNSVDNARSIGPQTGDGELIGGFHDALLWIELQPQYRDNNLQLQGEFTGERFTGKWMWISFAGISNSGRFEAVRF